ncbi:MAG TPA: hypothetical protein VMD91_14070 [Candidatus Sulfotelmatobacter sp.]|nr:hypothetical protein [Candidatus Sulfotelmatobacter sp.]
MLSARRSLAAALALALPLVAVPAAAQTVGQTYRIGDAAGTGATSMGAIYATLDGYCRVVSKLRAQPHPASLSPAQVHHLAPAIDFVRDGLHVQVVHGPAQLPCVHGPRYFSVRILDGRAMFGATAGWVNAANLVAAK